MKGLCVFFLGAATILYLLGALGWEGAFAPAGVLSAIGAACFLWWRLGRKTPASGGKGGRT